MNNIESEFTIRKEICEIGNRMYDKGFVAANDGNISVRLGTDMLIVTPTGVSKGNMKPEQLVKMKLNGEVYGKNLPSSEVKMHIEVYNQNPSLRAVCHAHPPISTAFAVARIQLDKPILAEAVVNLGVVPVARYATPGTEEVPNSIKEFVNDHNAVLLANHGLLTWGTTLEQAWFRMESTEHYGKILLYVKQIGPAREFDCDQLTELIKIKDKIEGKTGTVAKCDIDTDNLTNTEIEELIKAVTKKVYESL